MSATIRDSATEFTPLGRIGKPEEVAATVAFLLSPNAGFISATVINVDGGIGMGH